jgi:hypothetical protein
LERIGSEERGGIPASLDLGVRGLRQHVNEAAGLGVWSAALLDRLILMLDDEQTKVRASSWLKIMIQSPRSVALEVLRQRSALLPPVAPWREDHGVSRFVEDIRRARANGRLGERFSLAGSRL